MAKQLAPSRVACCGLLCFSCRPQGECDCRTNNHCGKRLSPQGCYQYTCCQAKRLTGCWECPQAPCGKDMLAQDKVKTRAFLACIKRDGMERFLQYLARNAQSGILYHRDGIRGDYDLPTEAAVLRLLRTGKI